MPQWVPTSGVIQLDGACGQGTKPVVEVMYIFGGVGKGIDLWP